MSDENNVKNSEDNEVIQIGADVFSGNIPAIFETTPVWKLVVLSTLSLGIYDIIWSYNLWHTLKYEAKFDILPLPRAIFIGLTNFWLFHILDRYFKSFNIKSIRPVGFALLYLFFVLFAKADNLLYFLCFLSVIPLAVIQHKINIINETNNLSTRINCWNIANTLWAIPLSLLFILILLGALIPNTD